MASKGKDWEKIEKWEKIDYQGAIAEWKISFLVE